MGWNSLGKDAVLILVLMDNQNTDHGFSNESIEFAS